MRAAVGSFCKGVRQELKEFVYINLSDFANETRLAKTIVIERPRFWEFELAIELLESKLPEINQSYSELADDKIIQMKVNMEREQLLNFVQASLSTITAMADQFKKVLVEMTESFGPPGVAGKAIEIKKAIDRILQIAKALLMWEYQVNAIILPDDLKRIKQLMKGWSIVFIDEFNRLAPQLKKIVEEAKTSRTQVKKRIELVLATPAGMDEITEILRRSYY